MTTSIEFDQAKAEQFGGSLLAALNNAASVLMISTGYQTGLLEVMAGLAPSTSEEIAGAAGLNERYVREWLGGMTLARVVEYDATTRRYALPQEHAAFLTRAAGPNNMAILARAVALLAGIEKPVVEAFHTGAGVPYSAYEDLASIQDELNGPYIDAALLDAVLPLAPDAVEQLKQGADALEIGSGSGRASNLMAGAFPNSRFTGYDFLPDSVAFAREEATRRNLGNVRHVVQDIDTMSDTERYDFVLAIDVLHDLAHPVEALRRVYASLRPGGVMLAGDPAVSSRLENNLEHPAGPLILATSLYHCMAVSLAQGGEGLGGMAGEEKTSALIREAGFDALEVHHLEGDFYYAFYVARKA